MDGSRFEFFEEHFAAGRESIERATAARLERAAPELMALARRGGAAVLREPLVHAWLAQEAPQIALTQLVYGHLREEDRPSRMTVRPSRGGVVHLPGLGALYLDQGVSSGAPAESLQLRTCPGQAPTLWRESQQVPAVLRTRRTVPGTELELYEELHPFFTSCFRQRPSDHEVEVAATTRRSLPALTRALELLGRVAPGLLAQLRRDGRALVVLQSDKVSSMASLATYGLVFISVPEEPSELFFGEELVHQISHVSFYAVTAQPCFTIPSETPLSRFTVLAADHRTMFTAFHGNYTIMRMAQFFDACLEGGTPSEPLRHELIGRFALALARFEAGLIAIDDERLYTPIAWRLHRRMIEVYEDLDARHRKLIEGYDLTNQPYVFDYPAFCSRNPCEGTRSLSSRSS